jgi:hypothetical protein
MVGTESGTDVGLRVPEQAVKTMANKVNGISLRMK